MSHQLISLSPDLKRLRDEGYEIQVCGGYLLIHHIPYVNGNREVKFGILVSELNLLNSTRTAKPNNHVIYFSGEQPCNQDGTVITQIQHGGVTMTPAPGVTVNLSFSNKPPSGYDDYYHKVTRYAEIISAPAKSLDNSVTERTFKVIADDTKDAVFNYVDTNSSRASIMHLNAKFTGQKIAIIGLGGTGSYILDLVAKTAVSEIHLFDGDLFHLHNAFRSPGTPTTEQLEKQMKKVAYYTEIYSRLHKHVIPHDCYISNENMEILSQMSFVFISVDKNSVRKGLIDYLLEKHVAFIDVGLGVNLVDDTLIGTLRVTAGTRTKSDHLSNRISFVDNDNNDYAPNIQIADLNCLNATLAVIKWKKMTGFYQDLQNEHHSTYSINVAQLQNEDFTT